MEKDLQQYAYKLYRKDKKEQNLKYYCSYNTFKSDEYLMNKYLTDAKIIERGLKLNKIIKYNMVHLDAKKHDNQIIISIESFEHLLNCLDNQKFLPVPEKQTDIEKNEMQQYIDDFNMQCRDLLNL
jgi:hypothetical protein